MVLEEPPPSGAASCCVALQRCAQPGAIDRNASSRRKQEEDRDRGEWCLALSASKTKQGHLAPGPREFIEATGQPRCCCCLLPPGPWPMASASPSARQDDGGTGKEQLLPPSQRFSQPQRPLPAADRRGRGSLFRRRVMLIRWESQSTCRVKIFQKKDMQSKNCGME